MKKALLILPMLAGISTAATTDVFDFGRTDSTTAGAINITKAVGSNDVPAPTSGNLQNMAGVFDISYVRGGGGSGAGGISPTLTSTEEANWKNNFTGDRPFGLADTFADGLLVQTNTNEGAITLTFSGLQAGTYKLSAFGGYHGQDPISNLTAELSTEADWTTRQTNTSDGAWGTEVTATGVSSYSFTNSSNAEIDHGYALTAENITVGEEGTLEFKIKGVGGVAGPTGAEGYDRTPLNYVALTQVSTVPEPATATLSLLALAGLAMRRRRK